MSSKWQHICILFSISGVFTACSVSKFIPEGRYLLDDVKVVSDNKDVKPSDVSGYIRQNPNSRWFSLMKVPLYVYAFSGTDTTKWINRFIQKIGDEPVIYDAYYAERSRTDMERALRNMGYMQAYVELNEEIRKKKLKLTYRLHAGAPYRIGSWKYDIRDEGVREELADYESHLMQDSMMSTSWMRSVNR